MIGRGPLRISHLLTVSVFTAGLVFAGFVTHPSPAYAGSGDVQTSVTHIVSFQSDGTVTQHATTAATVGDFLRERGIVIGQHDYVAPAPDVPLSDRLTVVYRAAVPVTIETSRQHLNVVTGAQDVASLLDEAHIQVGLHDTVQPALADAVPANGVVTITHLVTWDKTEKANIAAPIVRRLDFSLAPGTSKVLAKGAPGEREVRVRFMQRDNGAISKYVVSSHVVRKSHPRIVAQGIDEYEAFARFSRGTLQKTSYLAASALDMVATAYTANCYGCSGITATGRPAGHGVVAVDPAIIPLGSRLYIPGYGLAIAGDTGGAIRGRRIDLGFNSTRDAMLFGRREVVVYRLK